LKQIIKKLEQNTEKYCNKFDMLFWLFFIFMALATAILFISGKTSIYGWIIAGFAFVAIFIFQKKCATKGYLLRIIFWIVSVVVLFLIYAFTTDTNQIENVGNSNSMPASSSSISQSSQQKSPFSLNQYMVTVIAIDDADYSNKTSTPYAFAYFIVSINKDIGDEKSFSMKSLKVTNLKVEKKESGNISFYSAMGRDNAFDYNRRSEFKIESELVAKEVSQPELMNIIGDSAFSKGENNSGYTGRLEFICLIEDKTIPLKADGYSLSTQEISKILKPATISFDVVIENETGETFTKSFKQELFTLAQMEGTEVINNMNSEVFEKN